MLTRRTALLGTAAVASFAAPLAAAEYLAEPDPLREGVQALVNEIRASATSQGVMVSFVALQGAADRLEALPGIEPIRNVEWEGMPKRKVDLYWEMDGHLAVLFRLAS